MGINVHVIKIEGDVNDITDIEKEVLDRMPSEVREELRKIIESHKEESRTKNSLGSHEGRKYIEGFLEQYENDCPIDEIVSDIASTVISVFGHNLTRWGNKLKKEGKNYFTGKDVRNVAIKSLLEMISDLKSKEKHDE